MRVDAIVTVSCVVSNSQSRSLAAGVVIWWKMCWQFFEGQLGRFREIPAEYKGRGPESARTEGCVVAEEHQKSHANYTTWIGFVCSNTMPCNHVSQNSSKTIRYNSYFNSYAGRRTDFRDKKSSDFSGEIFRERNYCPRTGFSGSNPYSILSHPVMSWYGSRTVGCPIGREITTTTCSLLGNDSNEGTPPDFERFFLEKRPLKSFSTNVLIRGKWIHSTAN